MELSCQKGKLSKLHYKGALSSKQGLKLKDSDRNVGHDFCGDSALLTDESNCSGELEMEKMVQDYEKKCMGKQTCDIDFTSYLKKDAEEKKKKPKCYDKFTQVYVQVACDVDQEELIFAKQTVVMVIFLGMLMALKFTLAINYLEKKQAFSYKKWDIDTCTPADYTVKLSIN